MSSEPFGIVYDGPALADGNMNVADLGPALFALGEVVARTNYLLNGDLATVTVRINASRKPGSFPSLLEIYQQVAPLVPDGTIKDGFDILAILGMTSTGDTKAAIGGVVDLWKRLKGEKPKVVETNPTNRTATVEVAGENHTVNQTVLTVYGDPQIHQYFPTVIAPLRREGVDEFRTEHRGAVAAHVDKQEARFFDKPWPIDETTDGPLDDRTQELAVEVVTFHTRTGYKWRFISRLYGLFTADMLDEDFVEKIHRGEERLSGTDWLRVQLRTVTDTLGNQEFQVLKVLGVVAGPKQESIG
jgi:hypothetical protein